MQSPKITIVIPNWNGEKYLRNCLSSIQRQTYQLIGITIVDNGSQDESLTLCRELYPDIKLISFKENRGFGAAVNEGIKNSHTDFICLLNNDTELDERFFEKIIEAFTSYPKIEFIAPKMISYQDRSLIDGAGDGFLRGGIGYRIGTMEADDGAFDSPRAIFAACAGAAVYRHRFFDTIGDFDEDFFAYLEDIDLHLRAARRGIKGLYLPDAKVYHIGSASSGGKVNSFIVKQTTQNQINLLIKNFTFIDILTSLPVILFHHFLWIAVILKHREIRAYISGLINGIKKIHQMRKKHLSIDLNIPISDVGYWTKVNEVEREVLAAIIRRRKYNEAKWFFNIYQRLKAKK